MTWKNVLNVIIGYVFVIFCSCCLVGIIDDTQDLLSKIVITALCLWIIINIALSGQRRLK